MKKMLHPAHLAVICALLTFTIASAEETTPIDLKFTAVDGTSVDIEQLRGKVVLIDFWATWCPPCRGEVPEVVATYKKYHEKGFEIIGISLDKNKDSLMKFIKENNMEWPQFFDGKGWENSISSRFQIQSIPAMWLVNKEGLLVTKAGRDGLEKRVKKLLQESGAAEPQKN